MRTERNQFGPRYYAPNHAQLSTAVKGDDRYQPKRFPWLAVFAITICVVGLVLLLKSMR